MNPSPVVAAVIVDDLRAPTRFLAAMRAYPKQLAGFYELPGGKMEPGEMPEDALAREIFEELGTALTLGKGIGDPSGDEDAQNPSFAPWPILEGRRMWVWLAEVAPGEPAPQRSKAHEKLTWVHLADAESLGWLPTNLPIVREVVRALEK